MPASRLTRRNERCVDRLELPIDTWSDDEPFVSAEGVAMQLGIKLRGRLIHLLVPLPPFDDLLGAKRDENANDNDPDLTDELAPAVQRLGQVNVHEWPPWRRRG